MKKCKWIIADHDPEKISEIARVNNVPRFVAAALLSRNLTDRESVSRFMQCDASSFHNPYLLKDMEKAIERIDEAVDNNERITVFGDYDADGITATYVLYTYLKEHTDNVDFYIPDRLDEGYGLSESAIDTLSDTKLIITVDTGITAYDQVEYAKQKGIDIIVTDHHTPVDIIPDAYAVIDPKQADCRYPYKELAGVGVALKLVYALADCDRSVFDRYCHIASIGTVADLAELSGENRYIVQSGIKKLRYSDNVGLKALFNAASIEQKSISASTVSFTIGPMLNAAGRVASAYTSLNLLLCGNIADATALAEKLCGENERRKNEEKLITQQAFEIVEETSAKDDNVIVVSGKDWHHGVIGIVASRITDYYYKPSVIISTDGTQGKASCRSIEGFNIFEAITACSEDLVKFGGHTMAAGLTIEEDKIPDLKAHINNYAKTALTKDILTPKLHIECELDMCEFDIKNIEKLSVLEPCGVGNKTPVFCIRGATVRSIKESKSHAFLSLEKDGYMFIVPAFNKVEEFKNAGAGDVIDIAGTLNINEYNGINSPQMILKDWHYSSNYSIKRDDVAQVYRMLSPECRVIHKEFLKASLKDMSLHKAFVCLHILQELNIIKELSIEGEDVTYETGENFRGKTSLDKSPIYRNYKNLEGGQ